MNNERLLKIEEVALLIGSCTNTINFWYRFKRENPDNEYAQRLPNYMQEGKTGTRYWKEEDIYKLIEFKTSIPQGRNGIMGDITQRYVSERKKTNGKKKTNRRSSVKNKQRKKAS